MVPNDGIGGKITIHPHNQTAPMRLPHWQWMPYPFLYPLFQVFFQKRKSCDSSRISAPEEMCPLAQGFCFRMCLSMSHTFGKASLFFGSKSPVIVASSFFSMNRKQGWVFAPALDGARADIDSIGNFPDAGSFFVQCLETKDLF